MANDWHVNPETGNPGRCRVDWSNPRSKGCPHGLSQGEHFSSPQDAVNSYAERREALEDSTPSLSAAQRDLQNLRKAPSPGISKDERPQFTSEEQGSKSFWGRNGKKIGGAVVAAFVLVTLTNLALADHTEDSGDPVGPQGDSSITEGSQLAPEDPLPPIDEEPPAEDSPSAKELGKEVGDKLKEGGEKISKEVTPERVDKLKEAAKSAKEFGEGLLEGSGFGSSSTKSVAVSDGVLFQGQSMDPTAEEVAAAQATLETLEVAPEKTDAYYNRVEQFGRSFKTGVVGKLEHRDIPQATFKNSAPQSRAIGGGFTDPYTGEWVEVVKGSSTDTDVDHVVPLHEVVQSESDSRPLSQDDRVAIANDFGNLQVVSSSINRSKNDKDPGEWTPPNASAHLRYAIATIDVKSRYGLTVDDAEYAALSAMLAGRQ